MPPWHKNSKIFYPPLYILSWQHSKYQKRIIRSTKLTAHDENNIAKDGDLVRIMETRPLSKTKRFRLVDVVEESVVL